ncbi:helix-turn-helix domain-containing protein [Cellulomonas dongxiuzhuiae]|uniref:Helix-turn-helix transcriptional regulator n=1 Tax=Cellulomonas dongxiuzhuiae TaxID=2819979 RepID=A0ABX8GHM8_9CELL|nr:helix-turn-helix transcriptional regulator [Cellulomonas dongxiuzhuiae]MBO3094402.1 helix-turn-helix domain-containing protein [Cellulomonas dongxiuzhuiae]QWC15430.1 helix-turn-helix transcriptional regulator [Cellulomonas dongxiuzhuiae]
MSETTNPLGTYLRARREQVTPQQVGLPGGGVRRTPGLRREEVAMLAGISADYYLRLERGRDRHPSVQVLEAIARVLQLDDAHRAHLLSLVTGSPRRRAPRVPQVPQDVQVLLDSLVQPAFVEGPYFDVLAANRLARALSPGLTPGRNQLRDLLLDPAEQASFPDWRSMTECYVASLRQSAGGAVDDPGLVRLTQELTAASAHFRDQWARHEVRGQRTTDLRLVHPDVGELTLRRARLGVDGAEGLRLVVYYPEPGTRDAEALALLASASLPVANAPHTRRTTA